MLVKLVNLLTLVVPVNFGELGEWGDYGETDDFGPSSYFGEFDYFGELVGSCKSGVFG